MNFQLRAPRIPHTSMVEQVLITRGIPAEEVQHYLHTTDSDIINPEVIENITNGAKMLISHISQNHKIMVQIDSDCDGYTSAAVLVNYLNRLFPGFVQNNITYRVHETKTHGIIINTVPEDVKLVIAPDSSSNEFEIHEELKAKGVDVLVIDHHNTTHFSEHACVINNQLGDYPTKSLSGVGMVYKFCSYLDQLLGVNYADDYLDLVALGVLADVMDLKAFETRHLVDRGLKNIRNPFFKGMVAKQDYSLKGKVNPVGVSFYIAPGVNAITRVGTIEEKMMLFESMLEFRAYEQVPSTKRGAKGQFETRVEQSCRNTGNVRNRQNKLVDASISIIEKIIEEKNLLENKMLAVKLSADKCANKAITGLIANKLMGKYQRPVLVLNENVHEDGLITWDGSGRNASGIELENLQALLHDSELVEYAEGHDNAFGVSIRDDNFETLIGWVNQELEDCDFSPRYKVDAIYHSSMVRGEDILEIADLERVWGQGVEEPMIAITDIKLSTANLNRFGETMKISLPGNVNLVQFKTSEEEYENLYSAFGCTTINVVGRCKRNTGWDDGPQIFIEDYEVLNKQAYYF
ncbi:MAG: DHH family phosphoesterase [Methanobrevibacter sp.]|nr:DHH family phosphoesterase [Methanobrevibacter sp.]